ncbi:hypothetical protein AcV5_008227 [Taiwanofungus camphoratus]|nr:hypothetical protein AcV5_008227 [Antrodia cinnamomea]
MLALTSAHLPHAPPAGCDRPPPQLVFPTPPIDRPLQALSAQARGAPSPTRKHGPVDPCREARTGPKRIALSRLSPALAERLPSCVSSPSTPCFCDGGSAEYLHILSSHDSQGRLISARSEVYIPHRTLSAHCTEHGVREAGHEPVDTASDTDVLRHEGSRKYLVCPGRLVQLLGPLVYLSSKY